MKLMHLLVPQNQAVSMIITGYTIFVFASIAMFLPLLGVLTRISATLLPGPVGDLDTEPRALHLDLRVINTPLLAFSQAKNEVRRMALMANAMYDEVIQQFYDFDASRTHHIQQTENSLDVLQKEVALYLVSLSSKPLSLEISEKIPSMIDIINEIEQLGDHTEALLDYLRRKKEDQVYFSDIAMNELKVMAAELGKMVNLAASSFEGAPLDQEEKLDAMSARIKEMYEQMKMNHITRLRAGNCTIIAGLIYNDMMISFQHLAECARNIATAARELH
jgi:phosphate:Na+ symporter